MPEPLLNIMPIPILLPTWPQQAAAPIYAYLHGHRFVSAASVDSPDPLRNCVWDEALTNNPLQALQCYALLPVSARVESGSVKGLSSLSQPGSELQIRGEVCLMLDFGVESAGWLEFEADDLNAEPLCSISEYNRPGVVNEGAESPLKTAVPERVGSTWRLRLNALYYEGMRFAWVRINTGAKTCHLRNLRAVCQTKPVNYNGRFQSSEPLLNRIWETGAYAVKLNTHQDHFGAILMERSDRHSWTGDAYVTQAVAMAAFGNFDFVRQNTERMQDDDNGIESYSLFWVLALADYLRWTGDVNCWQQQLTRICHKLQHALAVAEGPELESYAAFFGHDDRLGAFAEDTPPGNQRLYLALACHAAREVLSLLAAFPADSAAADLRMVAERVVAYASQALAADWTALGLHDGTEALLAGLPEEPSMRTALAARIYRSSIANVSYSPFNNYFILQGMAQVAAWPQAGALLDRCWGGMLQLGATTFWESFRPEWLSLLAANDPIFNGAHGYTSLCHPWSSGASRWLSDHVLGVTPLTPGFQRVRVAEANGLAESVCGTIPTPLGAIEIERDQGMIRVQLPTGVCGQGPNGEVLAAGSHTLASPARPPKVVINGFTEQHEWGEWLADGNPDSDLSGDWGWLAFAATAEGDLAGGLQEAPFNVIADIAGEVYVPEGILPGGALRRSSLARREFWDLDRPKNPLLRGALRGHSPRPCQQTVRVRVIGDLSGVEEIALWFADPQNEQIILSVDVLAEPQRHLVLPTRMLKDFGAGKVLRFKPKGSFLLRVCSRIDSPDPSLSGIAWKRRA